MKFRQAINKPTPNLTATQSARQAATAAHHRFPQPDSVNIERHGNDRLPMFTDEDLQAAFGPLRPGITVSQYDASYVQRSGPSTATLLGHHAGSGPRFDHANTYANFSNQRPTAAEFQSRGRSNNNSTNHHTGSGDMFQYMNYANNDLKGLRESPVSQRFPTARQSEQQPIHPEDSVSQHDTSEYCTIKLSRPWDSTSGVPANSPGCSSVHTADSDYTHYTSSVTKRFAKARVEGKCKKGGLLNLMARDGSRITPYDWYRLEDPKFRKKYLKYLRNGNFGWADDEIQRIGLAVMVWQEGLEVDPWRGLLELPDEDSSSLPVRGTTADGFRDDDDSTQYTSTEAKRNHQAALREAKGKHPEVPVLELPEEQDRRRLRGGIWSARRGPEEGFGGGRYAFGGPSRKVPHHGLGGGPSGKGGGGLHASSLRDYAPFGSRGPKYPLDPLNSAISDRQHARFDFDISRNSLGAGNCLGFQEENNRRHHQAWTDMGHAGYDNKISSDHATFSAPNNRHYQAWRNLEPASYANRNASLGVQHPPTNFPTSRNIRGRGKHPGHRQRISSAYQMWVDVDGCYEDSDDGYYEDFDDDEFDDWYEDEEFVPYLTKEGRLLDGAMPR